MVRVQGSLTVYLYLDVLHFQAFNLSCGGGVRKWGKKVQTVENF